MDDQNGLPAGGQSEEAAANLIASSLLKEDEENLNQQTQEAEEPRGDPEQEAEAEGAENANSESEEPEYYDFDRFNPKTPIRLRDGQEISWGDLKSRWEDLQALPKHRQELEARAAQVHGEMQRQAQQAQFFQQVVPQALQIMQQNLPQPPRQPEPTSDPVENIQRWDRYHREVADYQARIGQIRQLQDAHQHHLAQSQNEHRQQMQTYMADQHQRLLRAVGSKEKIAELGRDIERYVPEFYGFTQEDISQTRDHRVLLMARDAIAYRKLQAEKPKAIEKVKQAPPVQQPGKRVSDADRERQGYQEERARLRKSGRAEDAVALLAKHLL
jgi:hypothetical protein